MQKFKKGTGEYVGFTCIAILITILFMFLAALLQFSASVHILNQSLTTVARAAAVCKSKKDADSMVNDVAKHSAYSPNISKVTADVSYVTKNKKWVTGNFVKVTIRGKINTIEPYWTSKTYTKSYIVAIEGGMGDINKAIQVTRKILYAVESGGQCYGSQNYADVSPAGANTSSEKYITIGAGQWYGPEACQVLSFIRSRYPEAFKQHDKAGISHLIDSHPNGIVSVSGAQKSSIANILSCPEGRAGSDAFMEQQIRTYFEEGQKKYGITDVGGLVEYTNIKHQGGDKAVQRLVAKAEKPLTADTFYNAMQGDGGNQVGAYRTRQRLVYQWIKLHLE